MRRLAALVLTSGLTVGLALAGCSDDGDDPGPDGPTGQAVPFVLGDPEQIPAPPRLRGPDLADLGEASVLVTGLAVRPSDEELVVLDRATSEVRWRLRGQDDRPAGRVQGYRFVTDAVVGPTATSPVVTAYLLRTCPDRPVCVDPTEEDGVLALDQATGTELWRTRIERSYLPRVQEVTDDVVLVDDLRSGQVTALDTATGEPRWQVPGSSPSVVGQHVIVQEAGSPVVVSLETGVEEWRATDQQFIVGAIDDALLVGEAGSTAGEVVPLDGGAPFPAEGYLGRTDGDLLVWFDEDRDRMTTLAAGEDQPTTVEVDDEFTSLGVRSAYDGYLFFSADRGESTAVLDRQGREVGRFDSSAGTTLGSHYVLVNAPDGTGLPSVRTW